MQVRVVTVEPTVLDASAVLALLQSESGADVVAKALPKASWSAVNAAETVAKLADQGMSADTIRSVLAMLALDTRPFDATQAHASGLLRPVTRSHGLSLGDRACLALAQSLKRPVLTADRVWERVELDVRVRLIR